MTTISNLYQTIVPLVKQLRRLDWRRRVFGARKGGKWGHGYRFNKRLPESKVAAFEREHSIKLPADYREFITEIGNGGAGPYYGIKPLSEAAHNSHLSKPFPWVSEILLEHEGDADVWSELPGVLVITEQGCGYTDFLVVHGQQHGQVWSDFDAAAEPLIPTGHTFTEWYVAWAERCIKTIQREPLLRKIRVGMTVDEVRAILGPEMRRWAPQRQLPDSPAYYIGFANTNASFSIDDNDRVVRINRMGQI